MMHRLDAHAGEWLDRTAPLRFTFEGREYQGYSGDTISSALAAAGVPYVARSFKYHRPRGILSFANHDSNTLFQVDGVPKVRGDVTWLRDRMCVSAINTFGGLWRDKARALDRFARLLPVGFYYKAFHSKALFPRWERMFRTLTGLGSVNLGAGRETTPKRYGFCDVLVIGGGPSGLSAALAAAQAGAQVALVDESLRLEGNGAPAALIQAVRDSASISLFPATVAAGYYADHWVALAQPARMTKMRAGAVVVATGVIEQPVVFRNNDLPGVMLASAASNLVLRYRVAPGLRVVVVAGNLEGYRAALGLHWQSVRIAAVVDLRADLTAEDATAAAECAAAGMAVYRSHAPYEAIAGADGVVVALDVAPLAAGERGEAAGRIDTGKLRRIDCD